MSREEALRALLEETSTIEELKEEVKEIKDMLSLIISVLVVSQKDAGDLAGVSVNTIRNKVLRGEINVLSANGSKLNYLTLKQAGELKPQQKPKRRV